jgi:hypothetical protein
MAKKGLYDHDIRAGRTRFSMDESLRRERDNRKRFGQF